MVDIFVGRKKRVFRFHKSILCSKIDYFKSMFSCDSKEVIQSTASFPEDSNEAFEVMFEWVYTGSLPTLDGNPERSVGGSHISAWDTVATYKLVNKLRCIPFMDAVMSKCIKNHRSHSTFPSMKAIGKIYDQLPQGAIYRKYASMTLHYVISEHRSNEVMKHWPTSELHELLLAKPDLALDLLKLSRDQEPGQHVKNPKKLIPICTFHVHGVDDPCKDRE